MIVLDERAGLVYAIDPRRRCLLVGSSDGAGPTASIGEGSIGGPRAAATDAELRRVYVVASDALVVVQRHATGRHTVDRVLPLPAGVRARHVVVDVAAGFVYVAGVGGRGQRPSLVVLDRLTLDVLGRTSLGSRPRWLTLTDEPGVVDVDLGGRHEVVDARDVVAAAGWAAGAAGT